MTELAGMVKTNHPYVVRSDEVCGGSPVLTGTRTRVIDIAIEYTILGRSPDEIIDAHPYVDLAKVHDALSYYYEHREEMDAEIQERIRDMNELKTRFHSKVWKSV